MNLVEEKSTIKTRDDLKAELTLKDNKIQSLEKKFDAVLSLNKFDALVSQMRAYREESNRKTILMRRA